jgi:hypothetical protein
MTIRDYLESKNVTPQELESYFKRFKDFEIIGPIKTNCYNCSAQFGVQRLRVGGWLIGQYCSDCRAINMINPKIENSNIARVTVYVER